MSEFTTFHDGDWVGRRLSVQGDLDTWQVVSKIWDTSLPQTAEEVQSDACLSWAHAEFLVESIENPGRQAHLIIDLQIPLRGTEVASARLRVQQASHDNLPRQPYESRTAWERLTALPSPVTSKLLGAEERSQDIMDDPVPNGWAFYTLVTKPIGVQLGTGKVRPIDGYWEPEGVFWTFDSSTRALIRTRLREVWGVLYDAGVLHDYDGLDNLFWDDANQRLYVHGLFLPTGDPYVHRGVRLGCRNFSSYGTAKRPIRELWPTDRKPAHPTVEELAAVGWRF